MGGDVNAQDEAQLINVKNGSNGFEISPINRPLGATPLFVAINAGAVDIVEYLLSEGADPQRAFVSEPYKIIRSPISINYLRSELKNGNDVNVMGLGPLTYEDAVTSTPLCLAATKGHLQIAKMLISYGAKKDLVDSKGRTPLILAEENGHSAMVELLLKE